MSEASRDQNFVPSALGVSSSNPTVTLPFEIVAATGRLKTDASSGGTVTEVSVVSANGFAGTVADETTTPAITLSTTVTGILVGNGTAVSAAIAADFPTLNQNTTGSAATLTTARTIGGVSFDGSANITVATATGGFTISGGDLALGANNLTMTGSLAATGARVTKGWFTDIESTNMPTVGGTSLSSTFAPIASPTFTGTVTIPEAILNGQIDVDGTPAADHTANGPVTSTWALGATIALMDLVFLGSGSKWLLTDADAIATASGMLGICLDAGDDTDPTTVALKGSFVRDDTWNWTPGAVLYMGETPGAISTSIPTGADAVIRVVGFAVTADVIYFDPSQDVQTTVA